MSLSKTQWEKTKEEPNDTLRKLRVMAQSVIQGYDEGNLQAWVSDASRDEVCKHLKDIAELVLQIDEYAKAGYLPADWSF